MGILHYVCNFSIYLKLLQNKVFLKKKKNTNLKYNVLKYLAM